MSGGVDYSQMQQLLNSLEKADADINEFYEDWRHGFWQRLFLEHR